jgi:hypothetical protein
VASLGMILQAKSGKSPTAFVLATSSQVDLLLRHSRFRGFLTILRDIVPKEDKQDRHNDRRYTADVAIHVHIIVTRHGQSFKTPPAYETCTREASAAPAA